MIFSRGGGVKIDLSLSEQKVSTMPLKSLKLINDYY